MHKAYLVRSAQLEKDDAAVTNDPVSQYAYAQLVVAFGCLQSLRQMIVEEDDKTVQVSAGPFGPYALVRNAMDTAALSLWLLEPANSKLRVKRRIAVQMSELQIALSFEPRYTFPPGSGPMPTGKECRRCGTWQLHGQTMFASRSCPPTTALLRTLERLHKKPAIAWLGAWQLSSGHAHGKQWATLISKELDEITRTTNDLGAAFKITIGYEIFAMVMKSAEHLIQAACTRYTELAKAP